MKIRRLLLRSLVAIFLFVLLVFVLRVIPSTHRPMFLLLLFIGIGILVPGLACATDATDQCEGQHSRKWPARKGSVGQRNREKRNLLICRQGPRTDFRLCVRL